MSKREKRVKKREYDEIDKLLIKKYQEVVVPDDVFDFEKIFKMAEERKKKRG